MRCNHNGLSVVGETTRADEGAVVVEWAAVLWVPLAVVV